LRLTEEGRRVNAPYPVIFQELFIIISEYFYEQFTQIMASYGEGGEGALMKRVDAVIRQPFLDDVKDRLWEAGVEGLTVTEVLGFGRQKGHTEVYRGNEYTINFHRKYLLTIIVRDEQVESVLDAIIQGARTGQIGDGKIFVSALEEVVRIRTGEIGVAAS
jgi:nitrogen regulatory protein PII